MFRSRNVDFLVIVIVLLVLLSCLSFPMYFLFRLCFCISTAHWHDKR